MTTGDDIELTPAQSLLFYIVIALALSACAGFIAAGIYVGWINQF